MRWMMLILALGAGGAPARAQEPALGRPIGSSWVSSDSGTKMTGFSARVSGGQCIATMAYETPAGTKGKTRWVFTAEKGAGSTRCSNGRWQDLSGSGRTGSLSDIIIKGGRVFWAQR